MRKSLLLLLGLTTGWISAIGSNYVLKAESNIAEVSRTEQTQNLLLSSATTFGKFVRNEFAVANNVQNCDPQRVFNAAAGTCQNTQITWNIPFSGDAEALSAGYPRVVDLSNNTVLAVNPNSQPMTLPVGNYEIQYKYDGDDVCNIPVVVRDLEVPVFTANCDEVLALNTDPNDCITTLPTESVAIAEGADNCSDAIVIWSVVDALDGEIRDTVDAFFGGYLPDSIQLAPGTNIVTFTLVDASNNTVQCTSTITVTDNNAPVFVDNLGTAVDTSDAGYSNQVISTDLGVCYGIAGFSLPAAFDTCAGPLANTYEILDATSTSIGSGTGDIANFQFPKGLNTVIVRATDGNFPIAFSFSVTVTDNEAPVITDCPANFSSVFTTDNNGTDDCNAEVTFPMINATDNCTGTLTYNWAILDKDTVNLLYSGTNTVPMGTLEPDTFIVAWMVEDAEGNPSDVCFSSFTVIDNEAPKRIGGAPATNQNLLVGPACDVTMNITVPNVGDNSTGCATSPVQGGFFQYFVIDSNGVTIRQDTVSNVVTNVTESFTVGTYVVSWIAEDYSGNMATIEAFQINVADDIDPTIDVNVFAGASDTTLTLSSFSTPDIVNDGCGLAVVLPAVTIADNCELDTAVVSRGALMPDFTVVDTLAIGVSTFNYTATDIYGNETTETITITVIDDVAPTLNKTFAYPDIVEAAANNKCSFTKSWNILSFFKPEDNCMDELDSLYIVVDFDNDLGLTDDDTLVANKVSEIGANQKIDVEFPGPNNTHNVMVKVSDKAGNTTTKSFLVTTEDKQLPVVTYSDTIRVFVNSVDCNSATTSIIFNNQLVSDNCTHDTTLLANMTNDFAGVFTKNTGDTLNASFDIAPSPFTSVVFTTMDSEGNIGTKTVVVNVIDSITPGVDLTPLDTIPNDFRVCEATTKVFAPTSSDACGIADVEYSINGSAFASVPNNEVEFPFTFPVGSSEIIWMVTDSNNNVTLDTQRIVVEDLEAPYITPITNQNLVTAAGECGRVFDFAFPTVTDNCTLDTAYFTFSDNNGNDTILENFADISMFIEPGKVYTAMVFASDIYGNIDSTSFNIILRDVEAPTMDCPATDLVIEANDPNCRASIVLMDQFAFNPADNCSDILVVGFDGTVAFDPYLEHNFPVGYTTVELTVVDVDGNLASCTFDVEVKNNVLSHIADFPVDTVLLTTNNECSKRYFWSEPRILGNGCNGETVTYTSDFNPGDNFPIDTTVVTYTFERRDGANNLLETYTQSFSIVVQDKQAPVITQVPADKVINVGSDCLGLLQYSDIDFQDNCDAQGITITIADSLRSGEKLPVGAYVVNILVTDLSGNTATASFNVTVVDTKAPTLTVPTSLVNVCGTDANLNNLVSASDECGLNGAVTFNPSTLQPGVNTVTATATDINGNSSSKTFQVNAIVNTVATITDAPNGEICEGSTWSFVANAPGAGETGTWTSATGNVSIANANSATTDITFNNPGTYEVIWTLTNDGCAGSSTKRTIVVLESVAATVTEDVLTANNNEVVLNGNEAPGTDKGTWSTVSNTVVIADENDPMTLVTNITEETDFVWTIDVPGCTPTSASVKVLVPQENLADQVETGFTPGAASNNFWNLDKVKNAAEYANASVKVFNRWGNLVFESTIANYNGVQQWDGTHDGSELPTAAYYYVIDPLNSSVETLTGYVTIIR